MLNVRRALVIERQPQIGRLREREGYLVELTASSAEAMRRIASHDYELVVIAAMLRDGDGQSVITWIKDHSIHLLGESRCRSRPRLRSEGVPRGGVRFLCEAIRRGRFLVAVRSCSYDCASGAHATVSR